MVKSYLILYVDNYESCEVVPQWWKVDLNEEEYLKVIEMVIDFEDSRQPYFFPQMYMFPLETTPTQQVIDQITHLKGDLVKWHVKMKRHHL